MRIDSPSLINDHSPSIVTRPCGLLTCKIWVSFLQKGTIMKCILSNKSAVGFDRGIVLMHCKILERFEGSKRGLNGKSESLLHRVWKIFAPENGKAEFSILFCWSGEINTPAQNIGVQLEITIWVTWFISSFESQTARLQLLSQCSQAGALCLFLAIHTKVLPKIFS